MRWSWPAFVSGTALGCAACVLLLRSCGEEPSHSGATTPASSASRVEDPARGGDTTAAVPVPSTSSVLEPSAAAASVPVPRREANRSRTPAEPPTSTPPAAPPSEPQTADPQVRVELPLVRFLSGGAMVRFEAGSITIVDARDAVPPVNPATMQSLARAHAAAEGAAARGESATRRRVETLLASADDADRELALGLAAAATPPMADLLAEVAQDARYGSLRAAALLALVECAAEETRTADVVLALVSDRHPDVSRTAVELLGRIGPRGVEKALALLRSGDHGGYVLASLVQTVASSERAADFLLSRPEPSLAVAVLLALPREEVHGLAPSWFRSLPEILRPLLPTAELAPHLGYFMELSLAAGQTEFVRAIAMAPANSVDLRSAAVAALVAREEVRAVAAAVVAEILGDTRSPDDLVGGILTALAAPIASDAKVRDALARLAASHPNRWIRELAREDLQLAGPAERGDLVIDSAIYGSDGKSVDVTSVLASRVSANRLTVQATNSLAGDPNVGTTKDLVVTYTWRGDRRTRTVHENETLTLP